MNTVTRHLGAILACGALAASLPAHASQPGDPWESFNRSMFRFNDTLDRYLLKPVARAYHAVLPQPVDNAVTRVFSNLGQPLTIVNELLQGKFDKAAAQTSRFMFNTTGGIVGIFDIATPMGLPAESEDFGQTLAVWGVSSGPYLMLPVFGPSTLRDAAMRPLDIAGDPNTYVDPTALRFGLRGLDVVDQRADLLDLEKSIEGDRYAFIRDYYLQHRAFDIADGKITQDDFLDDSLSDDAARGNDAP